MPLVSVPRIAKERYVDLCREHNETSDGMRRPMEIAADYYMRAISDICGDQVAGLIGIAADTEFVDEYPQHSMCCGLIGPKLAETEPKTEETKP